MANKEYTGVTDKTPVCRLSFPAVFSPSPDLNGVDKYSVTMLFDKATTDMTGLKNMMVKAARNEFGPDVDFKELDMKRIIDGDTKDRDEQKGQWVVRAKSNSAPGVCGPKIDPATGKVEKIIDPSEIYSGVYAIVLVTAKAYTKPKRGVTFYLGGVQKVKDGEAFAGGPKSEDVFEALDLGEDDVDLTADSADGMDGMFS